MPTSPTARTLWFWSTSRGSNPTAPQTVIPEPGHYFRVELFPTHKGAAVTVHEYFNMCFQSHQDFTVHPCADGIPLNGRSPLLQGNLMQKLLSMMNPP